MESVREAWTDERLDDLSRRMSDEFRGVREEIKELRGELNGFRTEINARFDSMQRTMIYCFVSLSTAMLAGFVGIATQL
jgi:hypothetical protein